MVEENGELYTINFCKDCYNLRQGERKGPAVSTRQWRLLVADKRSNGRLATVHTVSSTGSWRFTRPRQSTYAKILLKGAFVAVSLGEEWLNESPLEDLALLHIRKEHATAKHDGAESDQGGSERTTDRLLMKSDGLNPWMMSEAEGELPPGEAGGRSAQEPRAAGVAEEDWLPEADHRAS